MTEKRLIDANALLRIYKGWIPQLALPEDEGDKRGVKTCIAVLEDQPTVDAVEVVRCKYCEHYAAYKKPVEDFDGRCTIRECETDEAEFCSYGERKDNGSI